MLDVLGVQPVPAMSTTEKTEHVLRELALRGAWDRLATEAIARYGPGLRGFLLAIADDPEDAHDAFSAFCENMWKALPSFEWRCAFKTWAYTLARNALNQLLRHPEHRARRNVPLSQVTEPAARPARSATAPYRRTAVKDRFRRVRATLTVDERTLLVLRVDRKLRWRQIARIELGVDATDAAVTRKASALRKRFERLKVEIERRCRELAEPASPPAPARAGTSAGP